MRHAELMGKHQHGNVGKHHGNQQGKVGSSTQSQKRRKPLVRHTSGQGNMQTLEGNVPSHSQACAQARTPGTFQTSVLEPWECEDRQAFKSNALAEDMARTNLQRNRV